ncbi:MAG TPA: hypothetical protein VM760_08230, partial [Sphingomicrobium sp.]|nr:hypothetical protein [Sphingomicrobium sp.]
MRFPVAVALVVCTASAQAQTVHRVPQDHATIQQAINASADGDTVRVAPGEYFERLVIARRITLESSDGPQNTIVDATFLGPVLTITGVGRDTVVQGLTLTHGRDLGKAGGI